MESRGGEIGKANILETVLYRDMAVGALIAAFAATMLILYQPAGERPKFWSAVGRVGVAMIASLVVSAFATDIFKLSPKVTFALSGASGIFGVRVFVALSRMAKKHGIDLDDEVPRVPIKESDVKPK